MSLLKQIDECSAVTAWSTVTDRSNLLAVGTKDSAGVGFDDHGGDLEIHELELSDSGDRKTRVIARAKATSRFASISWSVPFGQYKAGLIAGGMMDGTIFIWDAQILLKAESNPEASSAALLACLEQHTGIVSTLHFNPHPESAYLLASGGADAEVFVLSFEDPTSPSVFVPSQPGAQKHIGDVSKVAWNSKVPHILASASTHGSTYIWDLRLKRLWCELRDSAGGSVSDISWHPEEGLQLVTAIGDDRQPVLKLWDLRSSTTMPCATLSGHTEGILSITWCPHDTSLLLSCSKDQKTILWDLFAMAPAYELPSLSSSNPAQIEKKVSSKPVTAGDIFNAAPGVDGFNRLGSSLGSRRFALSWSPLLPAVLSTASFDRRVAIYSLVGIRTKSGRPPKWLRRPVGATFSFGGKLTTFHSRHMNVAGANPRSARLSVFQVAENPSVAIANDEFISHVTAGRQREWCEKKRSSGGPDASVWELLKVICYEENSREELLRFFDVVSSTPAPVPDAVAPAPQAESVESTALPPPPLDGSSAEDVFGNLPPTVASPPVETPTATLPSPPVTISATPAAAPVPTTLDLASLPPQHAQLIADYAASLSAASKAEPEIRKAIVRGAFDVAVDTCLSVGLYGEALLLSQGGSSELRQRTQQTFFAQKRASRPFLGPLEAVFSGQFDSYVATADLSQWKETVALLSTFVSDAQFTSACESLGKRLETESGDCMAAAQCFMCASNVNRVVNFWVQELQAALSSAPTEHVAALANFVEKTSLLTARYAGSTLDDVAGKYFAEYAGLLAAQGRLESASKILFGDSLAVQILRHRLWGALRGLNGATATAPAFPFKEVQVTANLTPIAVKNTATATTAGAVTNPAVNTAAAPAALPAGWQELYDASSGRNYYVNATTGVSQWERPAPIVATPPAAAPVVPTQPAATQPFVNRGAAHAFGSQPTVSPYGHTTPVTGNPAVAPTPSVAGVNSYAAHPTTGGTPMTYGQPIPAVVPQPYNVASPVAMGGVPGAYGGIQAASAVPVTTTTLPGVYGQQPAVFTPQAQNFNTAAQNQAFKPVAPSAQPAPAPAPVAPTPEPEPEVEGGAEAITYLLQVVEVLGAKPLSPVERKQWTTLLQSVNLLKERNTARTVAPDVMRRVINFSQCVHANDWARANAIQTDLVNTAWASHKDWVKNLKNLSLLVSKFGL